jgi:hypothetical protein
MGEEWVGVKVRKGPRRPRAAVQLSWTARWEWKASAARRRAGMAPAAT